MSYVFLSKWLFGEERLTLYIFLLQIHESEHTVRISEGNITVLISGVAKGGGQGGHGPPQNICDIVFIVVFLMTHAKFIKQGQVWPPPWKLSSYATGTDTNRYFVCS